MVEENKYLRTLTENAQEGKIVALEELYEINLDQVHTLVSRLAGNKTLADELTKTILVRAWERISEVELGEVSFSNWIREFSVNITIDELRDPKLINDRKTKKKLKKDGHIADFSSDPQEKIVADLDLEHRIVFVLSRIENYNLVEVSQFLGINQSEAETILSEATEQISQAITEMDTKKDQRVNWVNLQAVIEPDENIIKNVFETIKDVRTSEIKEEEEELEVERQEEIKEIEKAIEKERKEKRRAEWRSKEWKRRIPTIHINKKLTLLIAVPILIFLCFQLISSTNDWIVNIESGAPVINDEPISTTTELSDGDIIRTNSSSAAKIEIPQIGRISIAGNTIFKKLDQAHSGELLKGSANIIAESIDDNLSIKIPEVTVENYGYTAEYSLETDHRGNSIIQLESGKLKVYSGGDEIVITSSYKLNVYQGSGASIPIHSQSTFEYSAIVDEYLFGGKRDVTLKNLLGRSSHNDIITLWNLLSVVDTGHQTENTYFRLYDLAPHSDAIIKADILLRKPDALEKWLKEIDWKL